MASVTELHVNGTKHRVEADPSRSLLGVLRDDLDLTGSKYGCGVSWDLPAGPMVVYLDSFAQLHTRCAVIRPAVEVTQVAASMR